MLLSVTLGDTQLGIPRAVFLSGNAFAQLTGKQVIITTAILLNRPMGMLYNSPFQTQGVQLSTLVVHMQ